MCCMRSNVKLEIILVIFYLAYIYNYYISMYPTYNSGKLVDIILELFFFQIFVLVVVILLEIQEGSGCQKNNTGTHDGDGGGGDGG